MEWHKQVSVAMSQAFLDTLHMLNLPEETQGKARSFFITRMNECLAEMFTDQNAKDRFLKETAAIVSGLKKEAKNGN